MSARSVFWPGVWAATAASDPHDAEAERRAERGAEQAVEQAHAGDDQRAAQPEAEALEAAREDRARQQGADQAEGGRIGRGGALRQQQRPQAGAEEGAEREAAEREHADDEALPEAEAREDGRERDNEPVERCHPSCSTALATEDHSRRLRRARPVIALACVAFAIGAIVGANHSLLLGARARPELRPAWAEGDYAAMYSDIDASSQQATSLSALRRHLPRGPGHGHRDEPARRRQRARRARAGVVVVPVRVHTRLFGTLELPFRLRIVTDSGKAPASPGRRSLAFPGLRPGERLSRRTTLPRRATLLARDGSVLAESPEAGPGDSAARGARPHLAAGRTGDRGGRERRGRSPPHGGQNWKPKGVPATGDRRRQRPRAGAR